MRNVDSRLTRHVPPPYRWSTEEKALISRAAIKVCSLLLRGGKKKGKFPPLPFIGSVYTRARHRVISLFLSQAGVQGSGTLLSPGLAFAPPFVFIRGSRGTLTATCRLPNPPFHPRSRFHRDRGPRRAASSPLGGGGGRGEDPRKTGKRSSGKKGFRSKEARGKNGTRVTRRASHDYVISSRLAFIIHIPPPTPSLSLVSPLFCYQSLADITLPLSNWKRARVTW